MLGSSNNHLVAGEEPQLGKNGVIRLNKYCVNTVNARQ